MKYRVLTVSREYGSGGGEIARVIARELGWRLIDKELITEISRRAQVPPDDVQAVDERVDPWLHRLTRSMWGMGADGVSAIIPVDIFDAEKAYLLARRVIEDGYKEGSCVIVGRGAQCVLRYRKDVFHAFIYAAWEDRVRRIEQRVERGTDVASLIQKMDSERNEYVWMHFKQNRLYPYLYDIMVDSKDHIEKTARLIISAMQTDSAVDSIAHSAS